MCQAGPCGATPAIVAPLEMKRQQHVKTHCWLRLLLTSPQGSSTRRECKPGHESLEQSLRVVGATKQASLVCFDLQIIHHRKQESVGLLCYQSVGDLFRTSPTLCSLDHETMEEEEEEEEEEDDNDKEEKGGENF
ncbi:unnamed protein product [Arctogadus glacialis]